jgi:hypothetical protein
MKYQRGEVVRNVRVRKVGRIFCPSGRHGMLVMVDGQYEEWPVKELRPKKCNLSAPYLTRRRLIT